MAGLIDTIRGAVSSSLIDSVASRLGESPEATGSALSGIMPVVLGAIANKADGGSVDGTLGLIRGLLAGGNPLDNPQLAVDAITSGTPMASASGNLLSGLFGSSLGPIVSQLAERFGLSSGSIQSLLSVAGLLGAGGIGRALGGNLTAGGLTDLMRTERPGILAALPAGLGSILGSLGGAATAATGAAGATAAAAASRVHQTTDRVEEAAASSGLGKILPWLLLALAALLLFFGLKSCNREEVAAPPPVETPTDSGIATGAAPVVIPTGAGVLSETRDNRPALNVYFDVGKSEVTKDLAPASQPLRDYLAANPKAWLTVSGFNDPTGNAAANAELSKKRAQQVAAALKAAGVSEASIKLEKPAETSGTGTTNAESRRVEVTIKE